MARPERVRISFRVPRPARFSAPVNRQPLDTERYFVILPDGIGRGGSSKPSDGLRTKFPHYGYNDMVTAQHAVVAEALGAMEQ
jgi:homoserine acetyltransferase